MHDIHPFPEPKNLRERLERTGHFHVLEEEVAKVTREDMLLPLYLNSFAGNIYIQIARWAERDRVLFSTTFKQTYELLSELLTEHFRLKAIATLNNPANYPEAVAAPNHRKAKKLGRQRYNNAIAPDKQE